MEIFSIFISISISDLSSTSFLEIEIFSILFSIASLLLFCFIFKNFLIFLLDFQIRLLSFMLFLFLLLVPLVYYRRYLQLSFEHLQPCQDKLQIFQILQFSLINLFLIGSFKVYFDLPVA